MIRTLYADVREEAGEATEKALRKAAKIIRYGGLVAFPTETVYGLGADGTKEDAAKSIYAAKGRPSDNPLILHIAQPYDAGKYAYTNTLYERLAKAFMPGPLTVVLPVKDTVPSGVTAGLSTVAIRCPLNSIAHRLIVLSNTAIAAPSANLSGSPSPTCAEFVRADMDGRIDMILDGGKCDIGLESTIVKVMGENELLLLRPGAVTLKMLHGIGASVTVSAAVQGELKPGQKAESPGMKYRHYAPKTQLILLKGTYKARQNFINNEEQPLAVICYTEEMKTFGAIVGKENVFDLGSEKDEAEQARRLFTLLREADKPNLRAIYAPLPDTEGIGLALYNRMIRAAAHQIIDIKE